MTHARLIWAAAFASAALLAGVPVAHAHVRGARGSVITLGPPQTWDGDEIRSLDPGSAAGMGLPWGVYHRGLSGFAGTRDPPRVPATHTPRLPPEAVLSNERTFTRWANVAQAGLIYQRPTVRSATIARLHWYTEDGFPEVYLLLATRLDTRDQEWIRVRIPMRPNGTTGWVPRQDLGRFHLTHMQITVNRARLRMYVYDDGHQVWSAPVAVGKASTPTPPGHFWIRERFKIEDRSSGYWPYAFGTSDYSTLTDWPGGGVVGIHGPYYQPQDIPGRVSHGCIRLGVDDDTWLAHHVGIGTPINVL